MGPSGGANPDLTPSLATAPPVVPTPDGTDSPKVGSAGAGKSRADQRLVQDASLPRGGGTQTPHIECPHTRRICLAYVSQRGLIGQGRPDLQRSTVFGSIVL